MKGVTKSIVFIILVFGLNKISFAQSSTVQMNEIYSRGTATEPDWIELYNNSSQPVDISSYKIYDIGGQSGTKPKKRFPSGTSIPAKGFYVVVTDGPDSFDFGLSSNGEEVWLEDGSDALIDDVVFPALKTTESYSRVPDGGDWKLVNNITKGTSNGSSVDVNENISLPVEYNLFQNYPNPFNPSTTIKYSIPASLNNSQGGISVKLKVFDLLSKEVATLVNEEKSAGNYEAKFNGINLPSGIYFYRLTAANLQGSGQSFVDTKKMILIK